MCSSQTQACVKKAYVKQNIHVMFHVIQNKQNALIGLK